MAGRLDGTGQWTAGEAGDLESPLDRNGDDPSGEAQSTQSRTRAGSDLAGPSAGTDGSDDDLVPQLIEERLRQANTGDGRPADDNGVCAVDGPGGSTVSVQPEIEDRHPRVIAGRHRPAARQRIRCTAVDGDGGPEAPAPGPGVVASQLRRRCGAEAGTGGVRVVDQVRWSTSCCSSIADRQRHSGCPSASVPRQYGDPAGGQATVTPGPVPPRCPVTPARLRLGRGVTPRAGAGGDLPCSQFPQGLLHLGDGQWATPLGGVTGMEALARPRALESSQRGAHATAAR
ncbi:hypothetical protein GCM10028783_00020 [Modestobacter muralis]